MGVGVYKSKKRDNRIDAIKGIGIILMVSLHAGGPFSNFINLFHMAIFFIASGWFWREQNAASNVALRRYSFKKIKSLWLPFTAFNSVLIILNNFFLRIGFFTDSDQFLEITSGGSGTVQAYMGFVGTLKGIAKTFLFAGKSPIASPTWFLGALCMTTISYAFVCWFGKKIRQEHLIFIIYIVFIAIGASLISLFDFRVSNSAHTVFASSIVYVIGVYMGKHNIMKKIRIAPIISIAVCFAVLLLMDNLGSIAFWKGSITNLIFFLTVSLAGWGLLWYIVELLPKTIVRMVTYLGKHSMIVLLLHMLCFKIITFIYLVITGGDMLLLASIPILEDSPAFLWIAYLIVGIGIPLLLEILWSKTKLACVKMLGTQARK